MAEISRRRTGPLDQPSFGGAVAQLFEAVYRDQNFEQTRLDLCKSPKNENSNARNKYGIYSASGHSHPYSHRHMSAMRPPPRARSHQVSAGRMPPGRPPQFRGPGHHSVAGGDLSES
eukprot:290705_1